MRVLAAAGACLALAACGDDAGPSRSEVESGLVRDIEQETGTRDPVVTCPDDVAEGDTCEVTAAGGLKATVRVTRLEEGAVDGEVLPP